MGHEVFISYSSKDKKVADAICSFVEGNKMKCWIAPRDITPGREWGEEIVDAIASSKVMVLVFSSSSNKSQHVLREVERAVNKNVIIIPFRIEDTEPTRSMEFFLYSTHWLDAIDSDIEEGIEKLKRTLGVILEEIRGGSIKGKDKEKEEVIREIISSNSLDLYEMTNKESKKKNNRRLALLGILIIAGLFFAYNHLKLEDDMGKSYNVAQEHFYQEEYKEAIEKHTKLAEGGYIESKNRLGDIYYNGLGTREDQREALRWYRKAAEKGSIEAKYSLAQIYQAGSIIFKDSQESIRLYKEVASYGNPEAQYELANFYEGGLDVERDYIKAAKFYRLAADQGHIDAQYMLGYMYASGRGVEKSHKESERWNRKAAEEGNVNAQITLGAMYRYGLGVERDSNEALKWYQKAAGQGNLTAKRALNELSN